MFIWWFGVVKGGYIARVGETRNPYTVFGVEDWTEKKSSFSNDS